MSEKRDAIVVGAGPAGAITATVLAQKGVDVLLLDRQSFPRDKTCGDAVPCGAIDLLVRLGMADKVEKAVSRGEFYPLTQMRLVSPNNHKVIAQFTKGVYDTESYVAPRYYFDAVLQQHAVDSGAEFRQAQVQAPVIENGRVTGVKARRNGSIETIHAGVVVGADGVTSSITRQLRPKEAQHVDGQRAVALRAYIDGIDEYPNEVEFYLYRQILPGYAWIFPTGGGGANIGLGMRLDHFRNRNGNLKQMLDDFLEMPAIKERLQPGWELNDVATWQLNFGSQKDLQHVYDGAILVGDAAGFINPLTGGGIHNAMISGELAAQTIYEALERGKTSRSVMQIYEERIHTALWESMQRSLWIQRLLLHYPVFVDFLVRRFQENSQLAKTFLTKL